MAKINRFILEYSDRIKEVEIPVDVNKPPKAVIHRFVRLLKEVDDSRIPVMIDYPMEEIILIAFLAVLGNASTWYEMEAFGISNLRWLKKFLNLRNGIPSHDTFRHVLSLIDTKQLQDVTVSFLMQNMAAMKKTLQIPSQEYTLICVNGKEQKDTGRNYKKEDKVLWKRKPQNISMTNVRNTIQKKGIIIRPWKKPMVRLKKESIIWSKRTKAQK